MRKEHNYYIDNIEVNKDHMLQYGTVEDYYKHGIFYYTDRFGKHIITRTSQPPLDPTNLLSSQTID